MSRLFSPLTLRGTTFPNRAWVSAMCQYSSVEGRPTDWHLVHLGSLARGGAGLVMTEATAVTPGGRISPQDAGIWTDEQAQDSQRIVDFVHGQSARAGIQLAHAGRKASTKAPWLGGGPVEPGHGDWQTVAPSAVAFRDGWQVPDELDVAQIGLVVEAFGAAAKRAARVGFDVAEIHAAHGYLIHEFLSPLSNLRGDEYGGPLEHRQRLLLEVVDAVRAAWPDDRPLFVRVSATDWVEGGLTVDEVALVARELANHGVDLVDVSSGGNSPRQQIVEGPGYQVPFAAEIRRVGGLPVGAVGLITEPDQAERIIAEESADAVFLARALLREPTWPQRAARELGGDAHWPEQYERARPRR